MLGANNMMTLTFQCMLCGLCDSQDSSLFLFLLLFIRCILATSLRSIVKLYAKAQCDKANPGLEFSAYELNQIDYINPWPLFYFFLTL